MNFSSTHLIKDLGDSHNFGKKTWLRSDGKVIKPRNTNWEAAFLSSRSPLRQELDTIARAGGMILPLPDLQYSQLAEGGYAVDSIALSSIEHLSESDVESIGVFLAVATWFGMTDLTNENMTYGILKNGTRAGSFCISPLDIESILRPVDGIDATGLVTQIEKPSQAAAHLSPNAGLLPLRSLMRQLARGKAPAILIGSFSAMFSLLMQNRHDLSSLIGPLSQNPVRVFLRNTDFYRSVLSRGRNAVRGTVGLLEEEVSQLLRGDIPYFFALPEQDHIFWFDRPESYKKVHIECSSHIPELKKLPRWPLLTSVEDHTQVIQRSVQSLVAFFWKSHPLDTVYAGTRVSNDPAGVHVSSSGHYEPVHRTQS